jgi:hypothetical protein
MFGGLKQKLFGSSTKPVEGPKVEAAEEEKTGYENGTVRFLERGKRQRHDYKHGAGAGAYDEKIRKHREAEKERPKNIEGIRHDFKSAFGGIEESEPAGSMTAEEMSLIFKNAAGGPGDFVNSKVTHGVAVIRPKFVINATEMSVIGSDGKPIVQLGELSGTIGKMFGSFHAGATSPTSVEFEEGERGVDRVKQAEKVIQEERERVKLKRLSKAFIHGIGDEMSNEFANAQNRGERSEFASEVLKKLIIAASNSGLDINELLEEIEMTDEEKTKEALALEALANTITDYWGGADYELSEDKFALTGPVSLTILRAPSETHKSGFGKKAHIGGEEFTGAKAYLGKRGQIICCFKPVGVEDYSQMEMPLGDCFAQLTGFQRHFVEQDFSTQFQAIRDAKNAEKQAADLEQFSEKYADFGSF